MRVVLLLDRPFARRERGMLARLEVGLADEGVRVVHAVPRAILQSEPAGLYSRVVGYDDSGFPIPRRVRVWKLLEALEALEEDSGGEPVDVVHAFAPAVWRLGLDAAAALGCAAALEVWSAAAVGPAIDLLHHAARPALLTADGLVMERLTQRLGGARGAGLGRGAVGGLHLTPWGVHGEATEREPFDSDRAVGIAMLVDGTNPAAVESALVGLAGACRRDRRIMAFINAGREESHAVWRQVRRLAITDQVSLITDAEARREAILRLDALVVAEPSGRVRSMVLDAMACGMSVIAAADPAVSYLIDGVTARLVKGTDSGEWERAIGELGTPMAELRKSAGEWVATNRSASAHVAAVLRAYDVIMAGKRAVAV